MKTPEQIEQRLAELRPKLALAYEHMRPSQPFNVREPAEGNARRIEATIKALEWVLDDEPMPNDAREAGRAAYRRATEA